MCGSYLRVEGTFMCGEAHVGANMYELPILHKPWPLRIPAFSNNEYSHEDFVTVRIRRVGGGGSDSFSLFVSLQPGQRMG